MKRLHRLREEYEAALDVVERRRAAYHQEIRKTYMSGVPLREIAEGLGVSHQRVHQIVAVDEAISRRRKRRRAAGAGGALAVVLAVALLGLGLRGGGAGAEGGSPYFVIELARDVSADRAQEMASELVATDAVRAVRVIAPVEDCWHVSGFPRRSDRGLALAGEVEDSGSERGVWAWAWSLVAYASDTFGEGVVEGLRPGVRTLPCSKSV